MGERNDIDWPHPDDLKPPQYGTGMHFPDCIHHECTGCLPPLNDLVPVDEAPASPFIATPAVDALDPIVKYDGSGQPVYVSDLSLGNRAERRAAARAARRRA